jgi:hypothetical protein
MDFVFRQRDQLAVDLHGPHAAPSNSFSHDVVPGTHSTAVAGGRSSFYVKAL